MKVLVVGNKNDLEFVKKVNTVAEHYGVLIDIVSEKEKQEQTVNDSLNKKHDEFLTQIGQKVVPANKPIAVDFGKDWPDPIQAYNNPRNRHERRKLAAESRRRR